MISLVPFILRDSDISVDLFADWLEVFYGCKDAASVSELYNDACGAGSAKHSNIVDRNDALTDSYTTFFRAD